MPDPTGESAPTPPIPPASPPAAVPDGNPMNLVPCPACGRHVSTKATSCPNCGHPIAPADQWTPIRRAGMIVSFVVGALVLGVQTVLLKIVNGEGVGADTLHVFLQTAPLTMAVAIIGLSVVRQWVEGAANILLSAFVLFASLIIGSQFGRIEFPDGPQNPVSFIYNVMAIYWRLYGPSLFFSALILGGFLAWAGNKAWPLPANGIPPRAGSERS